MVQVAPEEKEALLEQLAEVKSHGVETLPGLSLADRVGSRS